MDSEQISKLEEKVTLEVGVNIVHSCLNEIKSYGNFIDRRKIFHNFITKKYSKLENIDKTSIEEMMVLGMGDYEHDYKNFIGGPSISVGHPFNFEINKNIKLEILKLIVEREKEYIESLNSLYSEYIFTHIPH